MLYLCVVTKAVTTGAEQNKYYLNAESKVSINSSATETIFAAALYAVWYLTNRPLLHLN